MTDYDRRTGQWRDAPGIGDRGVPERQRVDAFGEPIDDERELPFGLSGVEDLDERERERKRRRLIIGGSIAGVGAVLVALSLALGGGDDGGGDTAERLQQAVNLQNSGRLAEAEEIYQEVIEAEPDNKVAYFNLGVIDHTQGQNQEASANYVQALSIDPAYVPALFNLAVLRSDEGDTQGAIGLYRRVVAIEPENAGALLNLGILLLTSGEEAEATELIAQAVALNPSLQQEADAEAQTESSTTSTDASTTTSTASPVTEAETIGGPEPPPEQATTPSDQ